MELLILGLALGVGAAKRKEVTKAVVKGYLTVSEKTREVTAHLKEDMRDAVAEARYEQDILTSDAPVAEMDTSTERVVLHEEAVAAEPASVTPVTAAAVAAASVEAGRKVKTGLLKGLAKSYLTMTEKTRSAVAQMREEMRDAVEEARFEREQAVAKAEGTTETVAETVIVPQPVVEVVVSEPTPVKTRRRTSAAKAKPVSESAAAPAAKSASENESVVKPPAKRRGRPPAAKAVVEAVPVKAPRRSKPKTVKTTETETPLTPAERPETALESAETAAAAL